MGVLGGLRSRALLTEGDKMSDQVHIGFEGIGEAGMSPQGRIIPGFNRCEFDS